MRRFFRSPISRAAPRFRARSKRREKLRKHLTTARSGDTRQRAFRKRPRRSGGCTSPVPAVFVNIPFSQTCRAASRFRARSKRRREKLRRHLTAAQSGDARQRAFRKRPRRSGGCASPAPAVFVNIPFSQPCRAASRFRAPGQNHRREKLRRHLTAAQSGDARQRAFRQRPRRGGGCASPVPAVFVNIPFSQSLPHRIPLPRTRPKSPPRNAAQTSAGCSKRRCATASLSQKAAPDAPI